MLYHLLHDERIADYQADNPRSAFAPFLAQYFTEIKTNELHEARYSNNLVNDFLRRRIGLCRGKLSMKLGTVRMPHGSIDRREHLLERLRRSHAKALHLNC